MTKRAGGIAESFFFPSLLTIVNLSSNAFAPRVWELGSMPGDDVKVEIDRTPRR